jgi:hypothetical protein
MVVIFLSALRRVEWYSIDRGRVCRYERSRHPACAGWWRGVGTTHNAIDEFAAPAGKDPVEYRRALLDKARAPEGCLTWPPRRPGEARRGRRTRHRRCLRFRQLHRAGGGGVRRQGRRGQGAPRRLRGRLRPDGQSGHDQGHRWGAVSFSAYSRRSTARSRSRTAASSRPISTAIGLCGWRKRPRSRSTVGPTARPRLRSCHYASTKM